MDKLTLTDVPEGMLVDRTYSFPLRREDAPMTALQSGDAARLLLNELHLAEEFPLLQLRQFSHLVAAVMGKHRHAALSDAVHAAADLSLAADNIVFVEYDLFHSHFLLGE